MCNMNFDNIRERIKNSNENATENYNKYPIQEQATLKEIWEYVPCECDEDCTCKKYNCHNHWRIKCGLSFNQIVDSFLRMFTYKKRHETIKRWLTGETPNYKDNRAKGINFGTANMSGATFNRTIFTEWEGFRNDLSKVRGLNDNQLMGKTDDDDAKTDETTLLPAYLYSIEEDRIICEELENSSNDEDDIKKASRIAHILLGRGYERTINSVIRRIDALRAASDVYDTLDAYHNSCS